MAVGGGSHQQDNNYQSERREKAIAGCHFGGHGYGRTAVPQDMEVQCPNNEKPPANAGGLRKLLPAAALLALQLGQQALADGQFSSRRRAGSRRRPW
jgi:hypothetical protein